jgi:hypothetical protein
VGTRQFMGEERGLGQDPAEILPDQFVQGAGRHKTRGAALSLGRPQRIRPPAAEIVVISWGKRAPQTRQLTRATADQAAEQVFMRGVVPAGHLGIPRPAGLSCREGLLTNDGRHGDGNPFLGRGRPMTVSRSHRAQGGLAAAGGHWPGALAVGGPRIDR